MIWLLLAGGILWAVYELWAALTHKAPTISQWVWTLSARWPILPFLVGFLMGHFFWRR